jgi:lipoprotein-releasing system permease protein
MKTELFICWRYLVSRRKEKFISLISVISVAGVSIGVMALIVVIAVMTGFDKDLRDKIVGNYSDVTISSYKPITDQEYKNILGKIAPSVNVRGVSPYLQGQVLIKETNRYFAVGIRGIEPFTEPSVTKIKQYLVEGDMDTLGMDEVIVGKEFANYWGLFSGATLNIVTPLGKERSLKISGIFSSGMYEYDMNMLFTEMKTAQSILGLENQYSAIAVKLKNMNLATQVKREFFDSVGPEYVYRTWMEANQNFFAALKLEKLTMFIILTLIILVASFNIVSTLSVMVVEKTKDIGILKAIGMSSQRIKMIFTFEGLIIGCLGILFGVTGGVILCLLLKKYQFIKLPQDVYYLDRLPVSLVIWPDITLIIAAALAITLLSTVYPAVKAARLSPVEALRYG